MLVSVDTLQKASQNIANEAAAYIHDCETLKNRINDFQYQQVLPEQ